MFTHRCFAQFIIEEYEALGSNDAAFWAKHSDANGARLSYSQVLKALKGERVAAVEADDAPAARDAFRFFGGDLSARAGESRPGWFEFRRGAHYHVVSSTREIACRWRKLLEDDDDVRAQWEATKDDLPCWPDNSSQDGHSSDSKGNRGGRNDE